MTPKNIANKIIEHGFYGLFFITPLIFSTINYELFEFPKMLFVYFLAIVITFGWLSKIIVTKKIPIISTTIFYGFLFFLISQIISTIISIHPYTSVFGYYSRLNGGLLSTLAYFLLFYIFLTSINKKQLQTSLAMLISTSVFVSLYALAQHFGIDANFWVQDVKNRVFSTLGQPNWLAAWLVAILPICWHLVIKPAKKSWPTALVLALISLTIAYLTTFFISHQALPKTFGLILILLCIFAFGLYLSFILVQKLNYKNSTANKYSAFLLSLLLTSAIFYTKSRSGILAFLTSFIFFWTITFAVLKKPAKLVKTFLLISFSSLLIIFFIGTEWTPKLQIDNFQLKIVNSPKLIQQFLKTPPVKLNTENQTPKYFISKSTDIRKAVWEGGLKVFQHWPVFGSGVETFAYSYYNFRVRSHNDLSEWDFLYNKAHNEYLNYLATTGFVGTTAIFSFIIAYLVLVLGKIIKKKPWLIILFILPLTTLAIPKISQKIIIYPPILIPLALSLLPAIIFSYFFRDRYQKFKNNQLSSLNMAILSGFISIIITNFYGFSVVTVALLFFLYPAFSLILLNYQPRQIFLGSQSEKQNFKHLTTKQWLGLVIIAFVSLLLIGQVWQYWQADKTFAFGKKQADSGNLLLGMQKLIKAQEKRPQEALYHAEIANTAAKIAILYQSKNASQSAQIVKQFTDLASAEISKALELNPVHTNFYKTATKIYLILSQINGQYFPHALNILEKAALLSPTDPKITLNLALLHQQDKKTALAEKYFKQTIKLKPNYLTAWLYLAEFYEEIGQKDQALQTYQQIIEKVDKKNAAAMKKINQLQPPKKPL